MSRKKLINTETLVEAVITSRSLKEAASLLGISAPTLTRRLREPEIAAALDEMRRELLRASLVQLHAMLGQAMEAVGRALDEKQPTSIQLAAARIIIENVYRTVDAFEFDSRLTALEQQRNQPRRVPPLPLDPQSYLPGFERKD